MGLCMMWSPDQIASNSSRSTRRTLSISAAMAGTPYGKLPLRLTPIICRGINFPLWREQTHHTLALHDSGHTQGTLSVADQ